MRRWNLSHHAISSCVTAALLSGCGGSQPPTSVSVIPQAPALATHANRNYKVVYSFGAVPDGSNPQASLIDVSGTLYGTTYSGGATPSCGGTVFSITPSGTEKVLHTFDGPGTDGCNPQAALIDVGGTLYGTTIGGGNYGCGIYSGYNYDACGTVFSITPGGKEKVLHYFGSYGSGDGSDPDAPLIAVKGTLYGTTWTGGRNFCPQSGYPFRCGTVFTVTLAGIEKVLYDFFRKRTDASSPRAGIIHVGRTFYGTTYGDPKAVSSCPGKGCGAVFRLTTGGEEKTLHSFGNGSDGRFPQASLIEINGVFYGTTDGGGSYPCDFYEGCGTVFSITPSGTEKMLHSFGGGSDGSTPQASLIDVKGTLYGTTSSGGTYGDGTVFSISTTGKEKVLHSFGSGSDGSAPRASLIDVKGTLYGTTSRGGTHGDGTVFALTP
ncbi:MAG: choice-of-anchor tandem repeat GloVer-containing protein [Candidatus Cybelea sp.]